MNDDLTPILVGAGQVIEKGVDPAEAMGPVELMVEAAGMMRVSEEKGWRILIFWSPLRALLMC